MHSDGPRSGHAEVPFVIPNGKQFIKRHTCNDIGRVDPSLYLNFDQDEVYEVSEEHIGRIWFRVRFLESNKLEVCLLKARNLYSRARKFTNSACSPFAQVELTPFCSRQVQTKIKKANNNPDFNEIFTFEVQRSFLAKCCLHFTLMDSAPDGRHKLIGRAFYSMREFGQANASSGQPVTMWRNLSQTIKSVEAGLTAGLINVSLTYYEVLERLVVTVNEIDQVRLANNKDIYVKLKRFQGDVKEENKMSSHHQFSEGKPVKLKESFQFKVTKEQRKDVRVLLLIYTAAGRRASSCSVPAAAKELEQQQQHQSQHQLAAPSGGSGGGGGPPEETLIGRIELSYTGRGDEGDLMREAMKDFVREAKPASAWLGIVPPD